MPKTVVIMTIFSISAIFKQGQMGNLYWAHKQKENKISCISINHNLGQNLCVIKNITYLRISFYYKRS